MVSKKSLKNRQLAIIMLDKVYEVSMLYDFYGQLLTLKQRDVLDLYYNNDYSLGEISDILGISRQGVHDTLKRSEKLLYGYEDKLHLVQKFQENQKKLKEVYSLLCSIEQNEYVDKIKSILIDILENNI